jgi:ribonuclease P protein component
MTPPGAIEAGHEGRAGDTPPAVSVCPMVVLTRRADFLRAARARRQQTPGFLLQARRRGGDEAADPRLIRVGYTCSKKLGNAVTRNRAKRRLREAARAVLPGEGRPGWDYVLVGRPGATVERPFAALCADLSAALGRVHGGRGS